MKSIQRSKRLACTLVELLVVTAITTALTVNAQTTEALQDYGANFGGYAFGTVGWSFQPLTTVSVTALGCFNYIYSLNNQQDSIEVGLWSADESLLASTTITSSSALVNQTRYEPTSAVQLSVGQTYYIGAFDTSEAMVINAFSPGGGYGWVDMAPEIQLGTAVGSSAYSFGFPDTVAGPAGSAILAPNFEFEPVPEPLTFWLVGAGALALLAVRRRR